MSNSTDGSDGSDGIEYYKFYHYHPAVSASIIFAVIFGISTLWHVFLIFKHKSWYFIPLVIGGIFEVVGYGARAYSGEQPPTAYTLGPYVIQTLLLLVAPALFAASIYMILGRIIVSTDAEHYSLIKKRWLAKTFVTSDLITFFLQLAGAGLMASQTDSTATTGSHIVLAGLFLQIGLFLCFVAVAVIFQRRLRAMPTPQSQHPSLPWEKYMSILYITAGMILARMIVRVAEFIEGFSGFIILHEVFLYIFDAVPMAGVMVIYNVWYPHFFSERATKAILSEGSTGSDVEMRDA